ncbi:protein of unknown function [Paraburkholderia dioscoreae]|uniref:Uncharacterized protein n=1 Tax=Paraburkholderia dioscoreae TaxID=2604047 RepID=A0A5Q4ZF28_9BURK|nr:protein of unknown function [Paraburkholderia dioscoreae]
MSSKRGLAGGSPVPIGLAPSLCAHEARVVPCLARAVQGGLGNPACYKTPNQDMTWPQSTPLSVICKEPL